MVHIFFDLHAPFSEDLNHHVWSDKMVQIFVPWNLGFSRSQIQNLFGQKPPPDQEGANKKKFSQIGPAVPEEIGYKHANILSL